MTETQVRQADRRVIAHFRTRQWAQEEQCHDEIARSVARAGHVIDDRLSPLEKAYVRAGAEAALRQPRQVLRFRLLEAALCRVSAESPDSR